MRFLSVSIFIMICVDILLREFDLVPAPEEPVLDGKQLLALAVTIFIDVRAVRLEALNHLIESLRELLRALVPFNRF